MSKDKEQQPPFRKIFYCRTGNLANQTRLDGDLADQFMRVGDVRSYIRIIDSDKSPENSSVKVGQDILAWKALEPLINLSALKFRPKRYHTLLQSDGLFDIQVHERQIDSDVRAGHFIDRSDSNDQFLKGVNKAVKSGLEESLFQEKLGLSEQGMGYFVYGFSMGFRFNEQADLLDLAGRFLSLNLVLNLMIHLAIKREEIISEIKYDEDIKKSIPSVRTNWKEWLLPIVPIDRWARGNIFLARHGNDLIIPRF